MKIFSDEIDSAIDELFDLVGEINFAKIMKSIMSHKKILSVALLVLLTGFWFYWFQWRPAQIRKECSGVCNVISGNICEGKYQTCLLRKGLNK